MDENTVEDIKRAAYEALAVDCSANAEGGDCHFCWARVELIVEALLAADWLKARDERPEVPAAASSD